MTKLNNAFAPFKTKAAGGKTVTMQYGYDEAHVYEQCGSTILRAEITPEENAHLRHMSHDDFVGPANIFGIASQR